MDIAKKIKHMRDPMHKKATNALEVELAVKANTPSPSDCKSANGT